MTPREAFFGVQETVPFEDAVGRIRRAGKAPGILAPLEADARHWLAQGCTVVAVGSDLGLLTRPGEELAAKFRK